MCAYNDYLQDFSCVLKLARITTYVTRMARPNKLTDPKRLNLLLNGKSKRKAIKLAFDRKISVGRLLEELVEAELSKNGQ